MAAHKSRKHPLLPSRDSTTLYLKSCEYMKMIVLLRSSHTGAGFDASVTSAFGADHVAPREVLRLTTI